MSFISTKSKFHVALDGVGLLLQGAPERPAYKVTNAPVYGARFASGDRDYNDLSQWWYLIQTDWSGGIKESISFEDDAQFYYSSNIDARTKPGSLQLEKQVVLEYDNTSNADEIYAVVTSVAAGNDRTHFIDDGTTRTLSGSAAWDSNNDPSHEVGWGDYLWSFGNSVQNSNTAIPYPFVRSDKSAQINAIIDGSIDPSIGATGTKGIIIGNVLYVIGLSTTDKIFIVKTSVPNPTVSGDWTLVAETSFGNSGGGSLTGAVHFGSEILYLVGGSPESGLYSLDIASGVVTEVRSFSSTESSRYWKGLRGLVKFNDVVLVTVCRGGDDKEDGDIWSYNGSSLTKIYSMSQAKLDMSTREAKPWLRGGCVVHGDYAFWGNLVFDGISFFNFIKGVTDNSGDVAIPVGTNGNLLYLVDNVIVGSDDQYILYTYDDDGSVYKDGANNEAFAIFSQHDKLQSIDKLVNSVTIGFNQFATGQAINIYYSTNPIPDPDITTGGWSLLGTASHALDGASVTSKELLFPVGTNSKKMWFRAELVSGGTDTPTLNDFTLEYLPMPDYKMQWGLNVNCADEVKRLDGTLVETTARELKNTLINDWQTKSALDFQDLDYTSAVLSDNPLSAVATTVNVDSTKDFPEQGRVKIDDEEMFYTGKTPTSFTGVTRGARGTLAVSHLLDASVHNGYRVLVFDLDVRAPSMSEDKHNEYIVGMTLREV